MATITLDDEYEFPTQQTSSLGSFSNENGTTVRPNRDFPLGLSVFRESNPEDYKTLEIDFDRITDGLVSKLLRENQGTTRRYLSDVVDIVSERQVRNLDSIFTNATQSHRGKLFIWRRERTHYHVVHDCVYSSNYCRCAFTKSIDFRDNVRRPLRQRKFIDKFNSADWINILVYFLMQKWVLPGQVCVSGTIEGCYNQTEFLRREKDVATWQSRVLEVQDKRVSLHDEPEQRNKRNFEQSFTENSLSTRAKRSKFEIIVQEVQTLLNKYTPVPPIAIKNLITPNHSDFNMSLFNPKNKDYFIAACDIYSLELNTKTFNDFEEFYNNAKLPLFYSHNINPFTYYHTREESLVYVNQLLEFQIGDGEKISLFLSNIRDWFNRLGWNGNPKMNAICVIGPPNSGKNYFFDMICALACNVGHIGRVNNKTNQFALQDVVNRRLVVGNEISMEEGAVEDFKKLCEGTAFNVRVKFKPDAIFTKTPVLLISNHNLSICSDFAFNNVRLYTMRWKAAELLKYSNKKPYPLVLYDLFKKYNITI